MSDSLFKEGTLFLMLRFCGFSLNTTTPSTLSTGTTYVRFKIVSLNVMKNNDIDEY